MTSPGWITRTKDSNATHSTLPCHLVFPLVDPCLPPHRREIANLGNFQVKKRQGNHLLPLFSLPFGLLIWNFWLWSSELLHLKGSLYWLGRFLTVQSFHDITSAMVSGVLVTEFRINKDDHDPILWHLYRPKFQTIIVACAWLCPWLRSRISNSMWTTATWPWIILRHIGQAEQIYEESKGPLELDIYLGPE